MADEPFSRIVEEQLPAHCGPTSLSACLAVLGIDASQREIARAAGKPWRIYREGVDEHEIKRAAAVFGATCRFIVELERSRGDRFLDQLRLHLDRHLPAVLLACDMCHWVAVLAFLDDRQKFVLMDPADRDAAFRRWSEERLLSEAWNEGDGAEPPQYFAIAVERTDGKPARWQVSDAFLRLCARGSADTADAMRRDLEEMVRRCGGHGDDVPLEGVLEKYEEIIASSVDHWTAQRAVRKAEMRQLLADYKVVAAAAGLRIPGDADHAALVAQMTALAATYAWVGEL